MALNNVPLVGQTLFATRDPINLNFSTIDAGFAVNHVPFNVSGPSLQGLHQFVQMPSGTPIIATAAGQIGLYAKNGVTSGVPELYFQRQGLAANSGYAITEGINTTLGFTTLPSGVIVKWGTASVTGLTTVVPYNIALSGPNITTAFHIQLTPFNPGGSRILDFDKVPWFTGFTPGNFTMKCNNTSQAITVYYYILGV